jgi:WD40 repeat protein
VSGSRDRTIRIWDLYGKEPTRVLTGHSEGVSSVVFEKRSGQLVSGSWDKTLKVWNWNTGELVRTLAGHTECVLALTVLPSTGHVVSSGPDGTIRVWDIKGGQEIRRLPNHSTTVFCLGVSPDEKYIICGGYDETFKVIDLDSGAMVRRFVGHKKDSAGEAIAFTNDGLHLLTASFDTTIRIWEPSTGNQIRTLTGHAGGVQSLAVLPNGKEVLSAGNDGWLITWDLEMGKPTRMFDGHARRATVVACSPDGAYAFSGSDDGDIAIWSLDREDSDPTVGIDGGIVSGALSKNGRAAIFGDFRGNVHFWDLYEPSRSHVFPGHLGDVWVAINDDGTVGVSWAKQDGQFRVWDFVTMAQRFSFPNKTRWPGPAIAISPDGKRAGLQDMDVLTTWDIDQGKELKTSRFDSLDGGKQIRFSGDGKYVLCVLKNSISWFDTITHDVGRVLRNPEFSVRALAVARNDVFVVTTFDAIEYWDLANSEVTVKLPNSKSRFVDMTSRGEIVVTADDDGWIRVWDLQHRNLLTSFCTDSSLRSCWVSANGEFIMAIDSSSHIHLMRLMVADKQSEATA